ncbi:hypothetical protein CKA32_000982 [Geitlerinema sp. FC II]|nr:hypothetical protein CKA32_000982 [Geitlerinema sp. FC II]
MPLLMFCSVSTIRTCEPGSRTLSVLCSRWKTVHPDDEPG